MRVSFEEETTVAGLEKMHRFNAGEDVELISGTDRSYTIRTAEGETLNIPRRYFNEKRELPPATDPADASIPTGFKRAMLNDAMVRASVQSGMKFEELIGMMYDRHVTILEQLARMSAQH